MGLHYKTIYSGNLPVMKNTVAISKTQILDKGESLGNGEIHQLVMLGNIQKSFIEQTIRKHLVNLSHV